MVISPSSSGKTNEKPSVIQTRRQELTTKPGVGTRQGIVWAHSGPGHKLHHTTNPPSYAITRNAQVPNGPSTRISNNVQEYQPIE